MTVLKTLLVDDDRNIRQTLQVTLGKMGCKVEVASSASEALNALKGGGFDFVLTDFRLDTCTGIDVIRAANQVPGRPVTVVMTAYASFENSVTAVKEGAFDYLPKPFSNSQLAHLLEKVRTLVELKRENESLKSAAFIHNYFEGMISPAMLRLKQFVDKVAPTDAAILMSGESGTGKSELARVIHQSSNRAQQPFVIMNCTGVGEQLFGAQFAGSERVKGGTLFLDEIGDLSLLNQARILRLIDERVIDGAPEADTIPLDVRILAATNKNLEEEVRDGRFREDLYYRLNVFECAVVPLRHRREDIPVLIERFVRSAQKRGDGNSASVPEEVFKRLISYPWPGNVRELRNVVERLIFLSGGRLMNLDDLPDSIRLYPRNVFSKDSTARLQTLEEVEKAHIERILSHSKSQEQAALMLGITTVTLWRKRKQYGLP